MFVFKMKWSMLGGNYNHTTKTRLSLGTIQDEIDEARLELYPYHFCLNI